MSTFISSLSELLALLVQSFNLSAMFPSLVFMMLNYLFVWPSFSKTLIMSSMNKLETPLLLFIAAIVVIVLAYFLNAVNHLLIRFLEGYPLRWEFPFNIRQDQNVRYVNQQNERIAKLKTDIAKSEDSLIRTPYSQTANRNKLKDTLQPLYDEQYELMQEMLMLYPTNTLRVMPTRLGNVIASAEDYPQQLFGIDSVLMWPYLVPTLTETGYAKFVEREKAVLDLLLNSAVLITLFGLEYALINVFISGIGIWLPISLLLTLGIAYILYNLAVQGAISWGLTIRAAFVLYRGKLAESLQLTKPDSYKSEWKLWQKVCDFFRMPGHAHMSAPDIFEYKAKPTDGESGNSEHADSKRNKKIRKPRRKSNGREYAKQT